LSAAFQIAGFEVYCR